MECETSKLLEHCCSQIWKNVWLTQQLWKSHIFEEILYCISMYDIYLCMTVNSFNSCDKHHQLHQKHTIIFQALLLYHTVRKNKITKLWWMSPSFKFSVSFSRSEFLIHVWPKLYIFMIWVDVWPWLVRCYLHKIEHFLRHWFPFETFSHTWRRVTEFNEIGPQFNHPIDGQVFHAARDYYREEHVVE